MIVLVINTFKIVQTVNDEEKSNCQIGCIHQAFHDILQSTSRRSLPWIIAYSVERFVYKRMVFRQEITSVAGKVDDVQSEIVSSAEDRLATFDL